MAAQPAIDIPDYVALVPPPRPLAALAAEAANLLADNSDLPAPSNLDIWGGSQEIRLGFYGAQDTFRALDAWAKRFGVTVTGEHTTDSDGHPAVRCGVTITTSNGLHVRAVAYIQADPAST